MGSISASRPTAVCSPDDTLVAASDLLQSTGRTAAVIADDEQTVLGVLTENDMLFRGYSKEKEFRHVAKAQLDSEKCSKAAKFCQTVDLKNARRLAFVEGTVSSCTVGQWLHGGEDFA